MGNRRIAREIIIKNLYANEISGCDDSNSESLVSEELGRLDEKSRSFILDICRGIIGKKDEIDSIIVRYADNWDLNRIAVLDKNILRLAIYEMLFVEDIPPVVSINEAIDIAKKFSTRDSGKFVNGILDKIHKELIINKDKNG
ncbi:MAG: transcription antitermination factor NusB [bacterium]|nr:transcription antitermination factor NusB [Candidatus Auribacterota bacterium]MDD5645359.1 transcription antitermination factor NusB [bacterium]